MVESDIFKCKSSSFFWKVLEDVIPYEKVIDQKKKEVSVGSGSSEGQAESHLEDPWMPSLDGSKSKDSESDLKIIKLIA